MLTIIEGDCMQALTTLTEGKARCLVRFRARATGPVMKAILPDQGHYLGQPYTTEAGKGS